ncbi:hypothetical protein F5888DRAFT_1614460, partial [Russula emetica]
PFWELLLLADIFISITPNILHQLLQGMIKHLIKYWHSAPSNDSTIDARCHTMPPNYKTMLFTKGISTLSRVSGHEHKKMCSILLGLVIDLPIPGGRDSTCLVHGVHALLNFLYLAQYQCHTNEMIKQLWDALSVFHDNKAIFLDIGAWENFKIPKLHSLTHYASSILLFGTTDNYNTEQSERLHIDFAKEAYRTTNRKDIYSQMMTWLQCREKILLHTMLINRRQHGPPVQPRTRRIPEPPHIPTQTIKMALNPTKSATFDVLAESYGAVEFQDALANFLAFLNHPGASTSNLHTRASDTLIPFCSVPVFNNIKFTKCGHLGKSEISDTVHAQPKVVDTHLHVIPGRFDIAIVYQDALHSQGNKGTVGLARIKTGHLTNCYSGIRIAQVTSVINEVAPSLDTSPHLAYVEWFSLVAALDPKHRMYKVTRMSWNGRRSASIIRVDTILSSVHLFP